MSRAILHLFIITIRIANLLVLTLIYSYNVVGPKEFEMLNSIHSIRKGGTKLLVWVSFRFRNTRLKTVSAINRSQRNVIYDYVVISYCLTILDNEACILHRCEIKVSCFRLYNAPVHDYLKKCFGTQSMEHLACNVAWPWLLMMITITVIGGQNYLQRARENFPPASSFGWRCNNSSFDSNLIWIHTTFNETDQRISVSIYD